VRKFCLIGLAIGLLVLFLPKACGATFQLNDGRTLTGDILVGSADENGVRIRVEEGKYERVPWASFSQEDIRKFAQDRNRKTAQLAEPFIEVTQAERVKKTEAPPKEAPRLERPAARSLLGAMAGSSVGLLTLLLIYAANLYAGYEVAAFRAQPVALVCGVSAVLPLIGPIIFLSMPTRVEKAEPVAVAEEAAELASAPEAAAGSGAAQGGLALASREAGLAAPAAAGLPPTQVFQRGEFTFNRRFFETKFSGFFGIIRRDVEKDMVLIVKSSRGEFAANRITRITGNDMHIEVVKGRASQEITVPFGEIREIQLKHKDA
jgi:hypothetical protein